MWLHSFKVWTAQEQWKTDFLFESDHLLFKPKNKSIFNKSYILILPFTIFHIHTNQNVNSVMKEWSKTLCIVKSMEKMPQILQSYVNYIRKKTVDFYKVK